MTRAGAYSGFPGAFYDYDFKADRGTGRPNCVRAGSAYVIDKTGLYSSVAANTLRIAYTPDPNGIERRNFIRNNTMQGAQAADGVELVPGGDFATDPVANGWLVTNNGAALATWNAAAQRLELQGDNTNGCAWDISFPTVIGRVYTLGFDVAGNTPACTVGTTRAGNQVLTVASVIGRNTAQFTATSTTMWIRFAKTAASLVLLDNVSVQWAGALPTNWSTVNQAGLAVTVQSIGSGRIALNVFGTANTSANFLFALDTTTAIQAANGQTWSASLELAYLSGSPPGSTFLVAQRDAAGNPLTDKPNTITGIGTAPVRWASTVTTDQPTMAFIQPRLVYAVTSGVAYNFTIQIGTPALELSPYATLPVIQTSGAAASVVSGDPTWNKIRNSVGAGTVVGGAGATNWVHGAVTSSGVTRTIVGTGVQDGIEYVDYQFTGTSSAGAAWLMLGVNFEAGNQVASLPGQIWTHSLYAAVVAGAMPSGFGATSGTRIVLNENNAALSTVKFNTIAPPALTATLTRYTATATLSDATAVWIQPAFWVYGPPSGEVVNLTLRIGRPQLEQAAGASPALANAPGIYTAPPGVPQFTGSVFKSYSGPTAAGLLVETSATNSIRNNSMQGAVVGGGFPTNWIGNATVDGITPTIVGIGVEQGVEYMDIQLAGTVVAGGAVNFIAPEPTSTGGIAAAPGQVWHHSIFLKLVSGTLNGLVLAHGAAYYQSDGVTATGSTQPNITPTSKLTRFDVQIPALPALTAFIQPRALRIQTGTAAQVVNCVIRIGWPQLEQSTAGAPSSPIRTTSAAVTRAADVVTAPVAGISTAATLFAQGTPLTPITDGPGNQSIATVSDGTATNRIGVYRTNTNGGAAVVDTGGSPPTSAGVWAQNVSSKQAVAAQASDAAMAFNGTLGVSTAPAFPPGMNVLQIGQNGGGAVQWHGYIERVAVFASRVPDATLQSMTT